MYRAKAASLLENRVQNKLAEKMDLASFLEWEQNQENRHDFVNGEIYAMAGASRSHEEVVTAVVSILWNALFGLPCRVYKGDRQVKVQENILYPDVVITCDERDHKTEGAMEYPQAIIEVASPRPTAGYDRDVKAQLYLSLPSLRQYAMINPQTRRLTLMNRMDGDRWETFNLINAPIEICGIILSPDRIFANVA